MSKHIIPAKAGIQESVRVSGGMTLVELIIALSIFTILVAITFSSISTFSKGFTSLDATNQMKSCSQSAVNRIGLRLSECKRIFQNTTQDTPFLSRITGIDSSLPGSRLPKIEEAGSLIPGDTLFNTSSIGNSLFFANTEFPEVLQNITGSDTIYTVRIDTYVFNYYYLVPVSGYTIGNTSAIKLMEWHSKKYVDYTEITSITDGTKKINTVKSLYNRGIRYAWDPTATSPNSAFYSLGSDGSMTLQAGHTFQKDTYEEMTRFARGVIWGRYKAGVSPNTSGSFNTTQPVPKYAQASGRFPSGFEIGITGPRSAHRILVRLVLVAQGPSNLLVAYENPVLISARNLW